MAGLSIDGPVPKPRASISKTDAEEFALKIRAAVNFRDLSRDADPFVKPILIHYSLSHLLSVYARAFLDWEGDRPTHGLKVSHARRSIETTSVTVQKYGSFPRLTVALFVLSGRPSALTPLITYSATPAANSGPGELLESFGKVEQAYPKNRLRLDELAAFDYRSVLREVRTRHGFHKFEGLSATAFLLDIIAVQMASSFARYDVLGWRAILEGRTNRYLLFFDEVFLRLTEFAFDRILEMLQHPSIQLDSQASPTLASPYSAGAPRLPEDANRA